MTGQLLPFLLECHRRGTTACVGFDLERPRSGHVGPGFPLSLRSRCACTPGAPLTLAATAKVHRAFHRVTVGSSVHRDVDRTVLGAHAEPDCHRLILDAGFDALIPLRA